MKKKKLTAKQLQTLNENEIKNAKRYDLLVAFYSVFAAIDENASFFRKLSQVFIADVQDACKLRNEDAEKFLDDLEELGADRLGLTLMIEDTAKMRDKLRSMLNDVI